MCSLWCMFFTHKIHRLSRSSSYNITARPQETKKRFSFSRRKSSKASLCRLTPFVTVPMSYMDILSRMEVSSLEDILTAPNLNNCFQAEDEDKGNGSSAQSNNAFTLQGCADENENEPVPTPVIETEEESKRRLGK